MFWRDMNIYILFAPRRVITALLARVKTMGWRQIGGRKFCINIFNISASIPLIQTQFGLLYLRQIYKLIIKLGNGYMNLWPWRPETNEKGFKSSVNVGFTFEVGVSKISYKVR